MPIFETRGNHDYTDARYSPIVDGRSCRNALPSADAQSQGAPSDTTPIRYGGPLAKMNAKKTLGFGQHCAPSIIQRPIAQGHASLVAIIFRRIGLETKGGEI